MLEISDLKDHLIKISRKINKWVSNNVKKVVIEILELDDIRKFLSSIDYKQYIHKKT